MKIVDLPDALEDEDELEMLNVGLLELVDVDDWKGEDLGAGAEGREDPRRLALKKGRERVGSRKNSPLLKAEMERVSAGYVQENGAT